MQVSWQDFIPQHLLSRILGCLANCQVPWLKNWGIKTFIDHYGVNMDEAAESDYRQFANFNAFFTRQLAPHARPIDPNPNAIISPADGMISEIGMLQDEQILQAKGQYYSLNTLLANDAKSVANFRNGHFCTAYLSPKDYHRVHMPFDGKLVAMTYVPGKLYSVNQASVQSIDQVFARNERLICLFDTACGPMAVILVGAMIVAGIHTAWHGPVAPQQDRRIQRWCYRDNPITLARGDEVGHFQLGSTVIVLLPKAIRWDETLRANSPLQMGQVIGLKS